MDKENKLVRFSGWSIVSALSSICSSDPDFVERNSINVSTIFSPPNYDPPDPEVILPRHLIRWPNKRL